MLIKQFLNENECLELLKIAKLSEYNLPAKGKGFLSCIDKKSNKVLNDIKTKAFEIMLKHYPTHNYLNEDSHFVKIKPNGWISAHKDWVEKNKQVNNFNVLLQKPKSGGIILHNKSQVLLNVGDAYILDASILHGVTTVKGNMNFYSLLLWFYK